MLNKQVTTRQAEATKQSDWRKRLSVLVWISLNFPRKQTGCHLDKRFQFIFFYCIHIRSFISPCQILKKKKPKNCHLEVFAHFSDRTTRLSPQVLHHQQVIPRQTDLPPVVKQMAPTRTYCCFLASPVSSLIFNLYNNKSALLQMTAVGICKNHFQDVFQVSRCYPSFFFFCNTIILYCSPPVIHGLVIIIKLG